MFRDPKRGNSLVVALKNSEKSAFLEEFLETLSKYTNDVENEKEKTDFGEISGAKNL